MQCAEYQRWLSSYLDGVLDAARQRELETHLKGCDGCAREVDSLKKLLMSLRSLGEVVAPADLLAGVQARLAAEPRWAKLLAWRPLMVPRHSVAVAVTAVLAVFIVAIPLVYRRPVSARMQLAAKPALPSERLNQRADASRRQLRESPEKNESEGEEGRTRMIAGLPASEPISSKDLVETEMLVGGGRATLADHAKVLGPLGGTAGEFGGEIARTASLRNTPQVESHAGYRAETTASQRLAGQPLGKLESGRDNTLSAALSAQVASSFPSSGESNDQKRDVRMRGAIQLQWAVADRLDAAVQLTAWLRQIQRATIAARRDRLIVQIPRSDYPVLLAELAKRGAIFPQETASAFEQEGVEAKEGLAKRQPVADSLDTPASEVSSRGALVTVEIILAPSTE